MNGQKSPGEDMHPPRPPGINTKQPAPRGFCCPGTGAQAAFLLAHGAFLYTGGSGTPSASAGPFFFARSFFRKECSGLKEALNKLFIY